MSGDFGMAQRAVMAALLVALYGALCGAIWWREARRRRQARAEAEALATAQEGAQPLLVAYASQTSQAEELARETARVLHAAGEPVQLCALDAVDAGRLRDIRRALFVASTYGEGDAPDNAVRFQSTVMAAGARLAHLQYAVLALGDRQYGRFCGFGRALDEWLQARGARQWFPRVEVDNGAPAALEAWRRHLDDAFLLEGEPAWQAPVYAPWTLAARRHLNPGSAGAPVFHIELAPPPELAGRPGALWESGDLAQVRVPGAPGEPEALRDYSIASIAGDGRVHLLVRRAVRPDGTPGLASGWLTAGLDVGGTVALRLRAHRSFRLEGNAGRPLVLIGNGTGLAGLRGHLRARARAGAGPNWLVFGERQAAHDALYGDELQRWLAQGVLQRLDRVFSRDQARRLYVQDRLREAGGELHRWAQQGAAFYVCGSLQGMAQGVDEALRDVLGAPALEALAAEGRYRRDVY